MKKEWFIFIFGLKFGSVIIILFSCSGGIIVINCTRGGELDNAEGAALPVEKEFSRVESC
jgi:hypothetical protein